MSADRYPPLEPGRLYHIYNRGNNSQDVFHSDFEANCFLQRWERFISPVAETFAYCLMKNHFHFAIRIRETICRPEINEIEALSIKETKSHFSRFFTSFAMALHTVKGTNGAVFKRRFQRREIETEDQFRRLVAYILFNPQKHRISKDCTNYPYGSYRFIGKEPPEMLAQAELLRLFGGQKELESYLHLYQEHYFPAALLIQPPALRPPATGSHLLGSPGATLRSGSG